MDLNNEGIMNILEEMKTKKMEYGGEVRKIFVSNNWSNYKLIL